MHAGGHLLSKAKALPQLSGLPMTRKGSSSRKQDSMRGLLSVNPTKNTFMQRGSGPIRKVSRRMSGSSERYSELSRQNLIGI